METLFFEVHFVTHMEKGGNSLQFLNYSFYNIYSAHSLQSLCFAPRNVIYYFIAPLLKIRFSVPVKREETASFAPTLKKMVSKTNYFGL